MIKASLLREAVTIRQSLRPHWLCGLSTITKTRKKNLAPSTPTISRLQTTTQVQGACLNREQLLVRVPRTTIYAIQQQQQNRLSGSGGGTTLVHRRAFSRSTSGDDQNDFHHELSTQSPQERTNQLLNNNVPIGGMTSAQWKDAIDELVPFWCASRAHESTEQSFRLLDRLVREHQHHQRQQPQQQRQQQHAKKRQADHNMDLLNTDHVLRNVILHWEPHASPTEWSAETVWNLVEAYSRSVPTLQPDLAVYNAIMKGFVNEVDNYPSRSDPSKMARQVQAVFDHVQQKCQRAKHSELTPNSWSYLTLMTAHTKAGNLEQVLKVMDQILEATKRKQTNVRFDSPLFEAALSACAKLQSKEGALLAEKVLDRMYKFDKAQILGRKPAIGHHGQVMNAWAKSGDQSAGEVVERMFSNLEQKAADGNRSLEPNTIIYSTVISAWGALGKSEKAERWLGKAMDKYEQGSKTVKPNATCFGAVFDSYAKSQALDAGIKAERLLRIQWDLYNSHSDLKDIKPTVICYNAVIDAWASSKHTEQGPRSTALAQEMLEMGQRDKDLRPDDRLYTSLLNAWAKSGNVEMAALILGSICAKWKNGDSEVEPAVKMFGTVLDAYSNQKSKNAGRDAEILLRKMENSPIKSVRPDTVCYNCCINAWAQAGEAGDKTAGKEALRLLQEMKARAKVDAALKPTIRSYTATIDALAKCGNKDAFEQAEGLLRESQSIALRDPELKPNIQTFTAVMDCWAKSGRDDAGENVERLLREFLDDPELEPNVQTFSVCLNAWAKLGNVERLEALLRKMVKRGVQPDAFSYATVLDALSRSGRKDAGTRADQYIAAMKELDKHNVPNVKPDLACYTAAHKCWMTCTGHPLQERQLAAYSKIIAELKRGNQNW